jgi:UDP-arabinose 4-epimerase
MGFRGRVRVPRGGLKKDCGVGSFVLVTGGAGFIGSHTCKALAREQFVPVAYDSLQSGHESAVKWGPLEKGNILDRDCLRAVLERFRPLAVIHFAASAYVGESVVDPEKYYINNIAGTLSLLSVLRDFGVRPLVFSSSCAVYGHPDRLPIREDAELHPINPYGFTKLAVEQMLRDFGHAYGLRSVSLRYFNAAGADPAGEIGEDHDPETHLIPRVLDVALGRASQVEIYGTDYDTSDGTCVRDYVHVSDLADAHVLALRHQIAGGGETSSFNLGTGAGYSVKEVVAAARRITGKPVTATFSKRRPGDPPALVADHQAFCKATGWQARRSALDVQITDAWRWRRVRFGSGA